MFFKISRKKKEEIKLTEYISIQDFANKSGLSRQTVYRKLDTELSKYYKEENGKKLISIEALNQIKTSKSCKNETFSDVLNVLKYTIEKLNEQIEVKDKQLKAKDEQIKALADALKTEQNISSQAHLLHAGTMKAIPEKSGAVKKFFGLFKKSKD